MDQDVFNTDRPLLFSIAYRMLGSASDAEDVLQDAWLRYRGADAIDDSLAEGVRDDDRHPSLSGSVEVRPGDARGIHRTVAARAGAHLRNRGPRHHAAARRVGDARVPRPPREAVARGAGRVPAQGRLRVRPLGDRRDARHDGGQLAAAAASGEGAACGRAAAADRHGAVEARGRGALRPRVLVRRRLRVDRAAGQRRGHVERWRRQGVRGAAPAASAATRCSIS